MKNSEQLLVDRDLLGFKISNTRHPMAQIYWSHGALCPRPLWTSSSVIAEFDNKLTSVQELRTECKESLRKRFNSSTGKSLLFAFQHSFVPNLKTKKERNNNNKKKKPKETKKWRKTKKRQKEKERKKKRTGIFTNILQKGNGFLLCRSKLTFLLNAFFNIQTCQ